MFSCKNHGIRNKECLQKGRASGLKFNKFIITGSLGGIFVTCLAVKC